MNFSVADIIIVNICTKINSKDVYYDKLFASSHTGVNFMLTFTDRLRGLREDNDLTQTQIADILGTSQTMYARYERGANEMPIRHLVALCKYYNVSADYLLGTTPDPHRKQKRAK